MKYRSLEVMAGAMVQTTGQSAQRELQSVRAEGDPPCMQQSLGVMVRPEMHQPDTPQTHPAAKYILLLCSYTIIR